MRKLLPLSHSSFQRVAPSELSKDARQRHIRMSRYSDWEQLVCEFTGGGSDASVFLVSILTGHPVFGHLTESSDTEIQVVLKVGEGPGYKRLKEDLVFFKDMGSRNPELLDAFVEVFHVEDDETDYAAYYMADLGCLRLMDVINQAQKPIDSIVDIFRSIVEKMMVTSQWTEIKDASAEADRRLFTRVTSRLDAMLTDETVGGYLSGATITLLQAGKEVVHQNPKHWIDGVYSGTTDKQVWMRTMFDLHYGTFLPSDTTPLNMMVTDDEYTCIDPGCVIEGDPIVMFSKLFGGLFSRYFQTIMGGHFEVAVEDDGPIRLTLNYSLETKAYNDAVYDRALCILDTMKAAAEYKRRNPFYKLLLKACGAFQFGADLTYRKDRKDHLLVDLYFFTRFTTYCTRLFETVYARLSVQFPVLTAEVMDKHSFQIQGVVDEVLAEIKAPDFDYEDKRE